MKPLPQLLLFTTTFFRKEDLLIRQRYWMVLGWLLLHVCRWRIGFFLPFPLIWVESGLRPEWQDRVFYHLPRNTNSNHCRRLRRLGILWPHMLNNTRTIPGPITQFSVTCPLKNYTIIIQFIINLIFRIPHRCPQVPSTLLLLPPVFIWWMRWCHTGMMPIITVDVPTLPAVICLGSEISIDHGFKV